MERLAFGYGTDKAEVRPDSTSRAAEPTGASASLTANVTGSSAGAAAPGALAPDQEGTDWAFLGLMAFTAMLFFRPQDLITPLRVLHLAELSALFALAALVFGRLGRGLSISRITPELIGVLAFALIILATAPFSVWMGGTVRTFTDLYAKVVLIFVLMVNTLTTPKRIEQFTWLIVVASGYIAGRAVLDYARGINMVEYGRVQGSVGGMFKNPNDLALNMVAVVPLASFLVFRPHSMVKRAVAVLCGILMLGAVVASQSRSGTVGLAAMAVVLAAHLVKQRPGVVFGVALAGLLALPLLPSAYWQRLASIADKNLDQTGSREARSTLLKESFEAFAANPLTGVGAGQFKNYNPQGRDEAWRESHNVVLQVASELGIGGLMIFAFLLARAAYAPAQTRRMLRYAEARRRGQKGGAPDPPLSREEHEMLTTHAGALSAALAGWFVCALFASVAYHWTFYYLLALAITPREYLLARMADVRLRQRAAASRTIAAVGVHP
jgi:putative inorganic carbon (hco3(-)) transporter